MFFSLGGGTCRYECDAPLTGPLINWVVLFSPSVSVQYGCSGVLVLAVGQRYDVQACIYVATSQDPEVLLLHDTLQVLRTQKFYSLVLVYTTIIIYIGLYVYLHASRFLPRESQAAQCTTYADATTPGVHRAHHTIGSCHGLCCLMNTCYISHRYRVSHAFGYI